MPNWCTNLLTIYGDKKEIQRFLDDPFLDFNRIAPMPKELLEVTSHVSSGDEENKKKSEEAVVSSSIVVSKKSVYLVMGEEDGH
jgi:hypothetical protein